MMLNYLKAEAYRIAHGRAAYLFAGALCAIVLAANVLLWAMASTPDFPYATVRFSLSNLISMLPSLFLLAGLLVCYGFGTAWFMAVTGADLVSALGWCVLPFIVPDVCKGVLACVLGRLLAGRLAKAGVA